MAGYKDVLKQTKSVWIQKLDKYLLSLNDKEHSDKFERTYDEGLHPSQISGCIRKTILKRMGCDLLITDGKGAVPIDPNTRRIFDNGTFVHERLQGYFTDMNVLLGRWYCRTCQSIHPQRELEENLPENEGKTKDSPDWVSYGKSESYDYTKILIPRPEKCPYCGSPKENIIYSEVSINSPEYGIIGFTDGLAYAGDKSLDEVSKILQEKDPEKLKTIMDDLYILEFKSENSFKFQKHQTAHLEHKTQAFIYALCLNVKKVAVIYESKDNQRLLEDIIVFTEVEKQRIIDKINMIRQCEKVKTIPESDNTTGCNYCDYKDICISNATYLDLEYAINAVVEKRQKSDALGEPTVEDVVESDFDFLSDVFD